MVLQVQVVLLDWMVLTLEVLEPQAHLVLMVLVVHLVHLEQLVLLGQVVWMEHSSEVVVRLVLLELVEHRVQVVLVLLVLLGQVVLVRLVQVVHQV